MSNFRKGSSVSARSGSNERRAVRLNNESPYITSTTNNNPKNNHDSSIITRRLYVGNLSYDVTWQDLKDHFRQIGTVARSDVMQEPSGRSKGCGLIEYVERAHAKDAIELLNNTELKGRMIFVREDREVGNGGINQSNPVPFTKKTSNNSSYSVSTVATISPESEINMNRRVYVGNLAWDVSWQDLKDYFKQIGHVLRAEVMSDSNGRSKGCGIVEFSTSDDAINAIDRLNETELKDRMIFVREDRVEGISLNQNNSSNNKGYVSLQPSFQMGRHNNSNNGRTVSIGDNNQLKNGGVHNYGNRLYVGNLSWDVTWQILKDHFKTAGNVLFADVALDNEGKSKGFGFIEFGTPAEAIGAATILNNTVLLGREIFVREDRESGGR